VKKVPAGGAAVEAVEFQLGFVDPSHQVVILGIWWWVRVPSPDPAIEEPLW
jgi:hypothetical protein